MAVLKGVMKRDSLLVPHRQGRGLWLKFPHDLAAERDRLGGIVNAIQD
jgi:hypothetical protein